MVGMNERVLVRIWGRQLVAAENLVTGSGERLQVIHPGRENRDSGPDFLGAIIAADTSGLQFGDVEIHRRASDWRSHGHKYDPAYNGVVLHVVWEGEESAVLQSGKAVPTLSLRRCLVDSLDEVLQRAYLSPVPSEPCHGARHRLGDSVLGELLDDAGEERFRLKTERFSAEMHNEQPSQVLYRGIMGALGYTKNKEQFRELAGRLPVAELERLCRGEPFEEQVKLLETLLLGTAGLLAEGSSGEAMSLSCWRTFRVRPENQPTRRLTGAAHLLVRFMSEGLLEGVLRLVRGAANDIEFLEDGFIVDAPEGCPEKERPLIGEGRVREIVVNIVLPFAYAWARANRQPELAQQALTLYRGYPPSGGNEITRRLTTLLGEGSSSLVTSARRQQGLIHLDKTFCRERRCWECPLAVSLQRSTDGSS